MGALPLWMLVPLVGVGLVAQAGQQTVRGLKTVAGLSLVAGSVLGKEASKQVGNLLRPDLLNEAIAADPDNPQLYLQRAQATLATGNDSGLWAVNDIERAIELNGGREQLASVEALFLLGLIHDRRGSWADAAEAFGHAIDALQKAGAQTSDAHDEVEDDRDEGEPTQAKQCGGGGGGGGNASPLSGRHKYGIQTFKKPTFCDHCSKLLIGFRSQGYQCTECKSTIHANCRQNYQHPCRTAPEAHCLRVIDFHVPTLCSECRKPLLGFSKQGLYCSRCRASVHQACTARFNQSHPACEAKRKDKSASPPPSSVISLATLYNHKGLALYHASQYTEAIVLFTTAASLPHAGSEAGQYAAIANRGLCHFYLEDMERAIDDLSQAIDHGVANEQVFATRATAFQLTGRDDLAEADRRQALLHNPKAIVKAFPYPMPLEVVAHVFSFLSLSDKARCAATCRLWHDLTKRDLERPSENDAFCYSTTNSY